MKNKKFLTLLLAVITINALQARRGDDYSDSREHSRHEHSFPHYGDGQQKGTGEFVEATVAAPLDTLAFVFGGQGAYGKEISGRRKANREKRGQEKESYGQSALDRAKDRRERIKSKLKKETDSDRKSELRRALNDADKEVKRLARDVEKEF
jgi:hypothetical protein